MVIKPFRLNKIQKHSANQKLTILDVGAGSHSPSITKQWLSNCTYHGIDITNNYRNSENDLNLMDSFFILDLTALNFDSIQDNFYDVIIMSHIIEHLHNGDQVIRLLSKKLKANGVIYIEYPSERSTRLPSMRDTLNFYDDPTHCRIYTLSEIKSILENSNFQILEFGTRRHWINIFLIPIKLVYNLIKIGHLPGGMFWDICGFAEYTIARKK
ncbi:MAG: class I SAM-dependent methyltransferase [Bacteroidota bacterium]